MKRGWSINSEDWKALQKVSLRTKTWKSVLLTMNDQALVPETPGVYAICARPPIATEPDSNTLFHSLSTPLYIGRSEWNIKSRFLAHCHNRNRELHKAKRCYHTVQLNFWFVELPHSTVKAAEAELINCFGPPVNRRKETTIPARLKPPVDA